MTIHKHIRTYVHESHMTFNKFEMLIEIQSMIIAGRGLEHCNFKKNYLS